MTINTNLPKGWTFILERIETNSLGGQAFGWFVFYSLIEIVEHDAKREELIIHYLTPYESPTSIKISKDFFDSDSEGLAGSSYEIGPKQIYEGLSNVFALNYGEIPSPPVTIPLHTIPPHKRDEVKSRFEHAMRTGLY